LFFEKGDDMSDPPRRYPEFREFLSYYLSREEVKRIVDFVEGKHFSPEGAAAIIEVFGLAIDFAIECDKNPMAKGFPIDDKNPAVKGFAIDSEKLVNDFLMACEKEWEINWQHQQTRVRANPHAIGSNGKINRLSLKVIRKALEIRDKYKLIISEKPLAKTGS
jgi:hypothetical protein